MPERSQHFDPRQSMRTQTFEVFHYRDSKLAPVAVHHHDFYEIYFFLSGQVEYRVEGSVYQMEPGDLLLISPLELHQPIVQPDARPYERNVLWIDRDYLDGLSAGGDDLAACFDCARPTHRNLLRLNPIQRSGVSEKFAALVRECYGGAYAGGLCAQGIFLQLMAELNRMALQPGQADSPREENSLISGVLAYIAEHYRDPLSLDELADRFYVSKYYLSHEFQQAVGTSVHQYIILKRLLYARQMLADGAAPGQVCHSCGFGDYANFYRAFRSAYGVSPRSFSAGGG